jgi:hypothetical protein
MSTDTVRSTIYLDADVHQAVHVKAALTHRSISEIVSEAVRAALREDETDLAAFEERDGEPPMAYEAFLATLSTRH